MTASAIRPRCFVFFSQLRATAFEISGPAGPAQRGAMAGKPEARVILPSGQQGTKDTLPRFPHPFCTRLQNLIKFQVSSNCQILRLQAPPDLVTLRAKDMARKRDWRARRVEFDAAVNEAPFSS